MEKDVQVVFLKRFLVKLLEVHLLARVLSVVLILPQLHRLYVEFVMQQQRLNALERIKS